MSGIYNCFSRLISIFFLICRNNMCLQSIFLSARGMAVRLWQSSGCPLVPFKLLYFSFLTASPKKKKGVCQLCHILCRMLMHKHALMPYIWNYMYCSKQMLPSNNTVNLPPPVWLTVYLGLLPKSIRLIINTKKPGYIIAFPLCLILMVWIVSKINHPGIIPSGNTCININLIG